MQEQEEKLRQEIIGDARTKADRLIKRAKRDAEKRAASARERQDKARQVRVKEAELRAEGRVRAILAGIDHEILTHWLLRREAVIEDVLEDACARAARGDGIDVGRSLLGLFEDAAGQIGPGPLVVRLQPGDVARLPKGSIDGALARLFGPDAATSSVEVLPDPGVAGGLVVASADGRRHCDNTYRARLRRLRSQLRPAVAARLGAAPAGLGSLSAEAPDPDTAGSSTTGKEGSGDA